MWRSWSAVFSRSLAWRLVAILVATLTPLLAVGGWYALDLHRRHLYSLLEQSAIDTSEMILSSTHSSMLENDRRHLSQIVGDIGRRPNVLALRLLDAHGTIRYSKKEDEVGQVQDVKDPVCRGCHVGNTVRSPRDVRDALALYSLPTGEGAVGLAVPVLNAPECSNNGCHVHPAEQRVLGMLDLEFSAAELEAALFEARKQMTVFSILAILGISGLAGLLTWRVAVRPLQGLLDGIRRLGRGELSHRLGTAHPAEIGELAVSFNEMSRRLETAQHELETWNQTLEERIREKTRELERTRDQMVFTEKMASLGKLAAVMAHEINNPLAGVLVYARLLRRRLSGLPDGPGDGAAERLRGFDEKLSLIETETARCGDIVRNLLLFSRRRETAREPADVNGLVDRALKLIRHQADLGQVAIDLHLDPNLPPVICDPSEVEQAVLALLMNAVEAMPDGGRLEVRTGRSAGQDRAEVTVTDTGPGIPEELQSRIFEPFFSTKSHGKGTGLGLAVVYGIAQRHGGHISLSSTPGQGASFKLALPVEPPPSREDEPALAFQYSGPARPEP